MKTNDTVYFYEHWSDSIQKGVVTNVKNLDNQLVAEVKHQHIVDPHGNEICKSYGTSSRLLSDLYSTHTEAFAVYNKKSEEIEIQYMKEIETVEDLVTFPLSHTLNGSEYTDLDAKRAYKKRAEELLGIAFDKQDQVVSTKEKEDNRNALEAKVQAKLNELVSKYNKQRKSASSGSQFYNRCMSTVEEIKHFKSFAKEFLDVEVDFWRQPKSQYDPGPIEVCKVVSNGKELGIEEEMEHE